MPAEIRFLALGDSYTIGEAVAETDRWPVRVAVRLRARGISVSEPSIIARTRWTTNELLSAIDADPPAGTFDLVTLLIGVNDQYRGRPIEAYEPNLQRLLHRAIAFAGGQPSRVVLLSIPDWGVTPFAAGRDGAAIAREIDAYNAIGRHEAQRAGAAFVDVTAISRRAAAEPGLIASDGLHPSAAMYDEWSRVALPAILTALGRS